MFFFVIALHIASEPLYKSIMELYKQELIIYNKRIMDLHQQEQVIYYNM